MTITVNVNRKYRIETVARAVEGLVDAITSREDRSPYLTQEERDQWASFPSQVRNHRYPVVFLDPDRPLADYLKSGLIGPTAPASSIDA